METGDRQGMSDFTRKSRSSFISSIRFRKGEEAWKRSLVRPLGRLKGLARAVVCFASIRESNFFPDKTALENCVAKQNGERFIGV